MPISKPKVLVMTLSVTILLLEERRVETNPETLLFTTKFLMVNLSGEVDRLRILSHLNLKNKWNN